MMLVILVAFWTLWIRAERAYAAEAARPVRVVARESPRAACAYGGGALRWRVTFDPNTGLPSIASDGDVRMLLLAANGGVVEVRDDVS